MGNVRIVEKRSQVDLNNPFFLGFFASIIQIILLRSLLTYFDPNELLISLFFAFWFLGFLLLFNLGSHKSFKKGNFYIELFFFFLLVIKFLQLIKVGSLVFFFLLIAIEGGISGIFYYSLTKGKSSILNSVYRKDALGDMTGALFIYFLFLLRLSDIIIYLILFFVFVILKRKILPTLILILIFITIFFVDNSYLTSIFDGYGYNVKEGKTGRFVLFQRDNIKILTKNGKSLWVNENYEDSERELFLPVALKKEKTESYLYNGELTPYQRKILKENSIKFNEVGEDFYFKDTDQINKNIIPLLKKGKEKYDVINIGHINPTLLSNIALLTYNNVTLYKNGLKNDGIVIFSIYGEENYQASDLKNILNSIVKTFHQEFSDFFIIPGLNYIFIFSNNSIQKNLMQVSNNLKRYKTNYIDEYEAFTLKRGIEFTNNFGYKNGAIIEKGHTALLNTSLKFYKGFRANWIFYIFFGLLIAFILLFYHFSKGQTVANSGTENMIIELTLIFLYQINFGTLYIDSALFIFAAMSGLFLGNYIEEKKRISLNLLNIGKITFLILILLIYIYDVKIKMIYFTMLFLFSLVSGGEFFSSSTLKKEIRYTIFGDYAGSFFAALLTGVFLIPILGVVYSLLVLILLRLLILCFR
jgi:hypothetical protein